MNAKTLSILSLALASWSSAAQAASDDPFAEGAPADPSGSAPETVPSRSKVPAAPASAPAQSASNIAPGVVEQLPAAAYPEPVTRGLYGGPLWLDMQGLQWPYMPQSGVGISGSGWIDGNYRVIRSGNPAISPTFHELLDQGRFLLRVTPTYTNGHWFVQANAEMIANTDQYDVQPAPSVVGADDVWVRTGVWRSWDITVGRMQGFDVYPLGMGLDLNTYERLGAYDPPFTSSPNGYGRVPALYNAEYLFYRPSAARVNDVALHFYPPFTPIRLELLGQFGNDGVENVLGGRPAAIVDLGVLKFRVAAEYQYKFAEDPAPSATNTVKSRGVAGSIQLVLAPFIEGGVNAGAAVIDASNPHGTDYGSSGDRRSFGGFVDIVPVPWILPDLMFGGGVNYATFQNILPSGAERSSNQQWFGAVQYLFYKQLYVKFVAGYAKSHFANQATSTPYDDDMFSFRLRVMYLF